MPFYILELRQSKSMKTFVLFWHFRTTFFFVLLVTVFVCTWQWQGSDGCSRIYLLACDGLDNFCLYFILGCCSNCYSIPSGSDLLSFICRLVFFIIFLQAYYCSNAVLLLSIHQQGMSFWVIYNNTLNESTKSHETHQIVINRYLCNM